MLRLASAARRQQYASVARSVCCRSLSTGSEEKAVPKVEEEGFLMSVFGPDTARAAPDFDNRWSIMVPAFCTHLAIGSGWAWSIVSTTIVREQGFVSAAAADWSLLEATAPMPILFTFFGLVGAAVGKWQTAVGPRASIALSAVFFGSGLVVGGIGISTNNLLLLNLGYGVLAGAGVGLSYTPPIQALMQWFPDKKGLAMGTLVAGFGSGALVFVPTYGWLMSKFSSAPTFLGTMEAVQTTSRDGVLFAQTASQDWVEAVQATATDLAQLPAPYSQLSEGLYVVGSGATGAGEALMLSGVGYFALMSACAFAIKTPAAGWVPAGYDKASEEKDTPSLTVDQVMGTPQFYFLGATFACLTTGTYGLFSVAKGMTSEVFSSALPLVVTASFTSSYLMLLSVANLSGRFTIATLSDKIGCKSAFNMIILGSLPIYLGAPMLVHQVSERESTTHRQLTALCTTPCVHLAQHYDAVHCTSHLHPRVFIREYPLTCPLSYAHPLTRRHPRALPLKFPLSTLPVLTPLPSAPPPPPPSTPGGRNRQHRAPLPLHRLDIRRSLPLLRYTHALIHTRSHTHTLSYTHTLIHTRSHTHTLSYTHALIHPSHTLSHALSYTRQVSSRHVPPTKQHSLAPVTSEQYTDGCCCSTL
jgi:hypothetical protein